LVKYYALLGRRAIAPHCGEESPDSRKQGVERKFRLVIAGVPSTEKERGQVLNQQDLRATVTIRS